MALNVIDMIKIFQLEEKNIVMNIKKKKNKVKKNKEIKKR